MKKFLLLMILFSTPAWCESPSSVSTDVIINLPIERAWTLFSTAEGLRDIGYTNVSLTLKPGGNFHAERKPNDNETVDGMISSFDPQHMLSWQWNQSPCWSVLYFNAMGNDMTQLRWIDLCGGDNSADLQSRAQQHRQLFDQLVRRNAPECHVCKEEREAAMHP